MKKLLAITLTLALLGGLFSGCTGGDSGGTATSAPETAVDVNAETTFGIPPLAEPATVRVALFSGSHHANGWKLADEMGWFREVNITIEYIPFTNGPVMMEAISDWDMGSAGGPGCITGMVGRDARVVGLASFDNLVQLYAREDSPIFQSGQGNISGFPQIYGTPDNWRDTTWLLPIGTTAHFALAGTLEAMGMTTDDVTMVNMDVSSALNAFRAGEGDGCGVWTSIALSAKAEGYKMVSDIQSSGKTMTTCVVSNPDFLEKNREVAKTVLEVYTEAAHWGYQPENREQAAQVFLEFSEEEGIRTSLEDCIYSYEVCDQFSIEEQLAWINTPLTDPEGMDPNMNQYKYALMDTFDFFMSIGSYTAENRQHIIDQNLIDTSLLEELAVERAAR